MLNLGKRYGALWKPPERVSSGDFWKKNMFSAGKYGFSSGIQNLTGLEGVMKKAKMCFFLE